MRMINYLKYNLLLFIQLNDLVNFKTNKSDKPLGI